MSALNFHSTYWARRQANDLELAKEVKVRTDSGTRVVVHDFIKKPPNLRVSQKCSEQVLSSVVATVPAAPAPTIVFFLADDQDQLLGGSFPPTSPDGVTPMPNVKELVVGV